MFSHPKEVLIMQIKVFFSLQFGIAIAYYVRQTLMVTRLEIARVIITIELHIN